MDPALQSQIDQAMIDLDKTENKLPLYKHIYDLHGKTNLTLPVPAFTIISGGKHAGNNLAVQAVDDDLLMSNLKRIGRTLHESSCNALLLKVKIGGQPDQSCKVFHLPAIHNLLLIVGGLKSETPFVLSN
ncbi:PREDICTED: cytosolic enolase 3 isoform X2 [Populus euphratica]|uniref:phosphopyruvate hydratase n=1 Tax=Populus euphratica TaxID=75702 RepID=A0AAJ6XXS9_POPEU|nr:PREDICTED: cytosolic enolase 3 isoform X2 [Populus euphratica]